MDSNETKKRLKNLIGSVGYALLKRHLRNVKLKIDIEKRLFKITKDGKIYEIGFDEIEQAVNDSSV